MAGSVGCSTTPTAADTDHRLGRVDPTAGDAGERPAGQRHGRAPRADPRHVPARAGRDLRGAGPGPGRASPTSARSGQQIHGLTLRQAFEQFGAFCAQYCQAVNAHHSIEDAHMFPALRRAEGDLAPVHRPARRGARDHPSGARRPRSRGRRARDDGRGLRRGGPPRRRARLGAAIAPDLRGVPARGTRSATTASSSEHPRSCDEGLHLVRHGRRRRHRRLGAVPTRRRSGVRAWLPADARRGQRGDPRRGAGRRHRRGGQRQPRRDGEPGPDG